jgi:phosphoadenosine phosphosulfate reductase
MRPRCREREVSELPYALSTLAATSLQQLRDAAAKYKNVCYANSLGLESMVLTDLIWAASPELLPEVEIFSIDTGRLFPETYELIERLRQRYGRALHMVYPDSAMVKTWVAANGIDGFRDGVAQRHSCCGIRKVAPFRAAIAGRKAWVTGIRKEQSASRAMSAPVEWDSTYGLYKISPLLDWTERDIWAYIRKRKLPYNRLHDAGYPSIGCAPCTRAVLPGDDERSGRWWWEQTESRECGLHPRQRSGTIREDRDQGSR